MKTQGYYAAATKRPAKADACITVHGMAVNTRSAARVKAPKRRRCVKTHLIRLDTGEWVDAKCGGDDFAVLAKVKAHAPIDPWAKWYGPESGITLAEWRLRKAAHYASIRGGAVRAQMAEQTAIPVAVADKFAALRAEQATATKWTPAELRRMAGF